jgi:hypothetical protein
MIYLCLVFEPVNICVDLKSCECCIMLNWWFLISSCDSVAAVNQWFRNWNWKVLENDNLEHIPTFSWLVSISIDICNEANSQACNGTAATWGVEYCGAVRWRKTFSVLVCEWTMLAVDVASHHLLHGISSISVWAETYHLPGIVISNSATSRAARERLIERCKGYRFPIT